MITIIIRTIIVQIEKFFMNISILLLLDKKAGKTSTRTAIKKIAETVWLAIIYNQFFQNFLALSKKLLITGLGFSSSNFLNSSRSCFCFELNEVGTSVTIFI